MHLISDSYFPIILKIIQVLRYIATIIGIHIYLCIPTFKMNHLSNLLIHLFPPNRVEPFTSVPFPYPYSPYYIRVTCLSCTWSHIHIEFIHLLHTTSIQHIRTILSTYKCKYKHPETYAVVQYTHLRTYTYVYTYVTNINSSKYHT